MSQILLDPKQPLRFQPEPDGPSFELRVPTVVDRPAFRHALATAGGRQWSKAQLAAALEAAVRALLPGEEDAQARETLATAIAAYREGIEAAIDRWRADRSEANDLAIGEALDPPDLVAQAEEMVVQAAAEYPRYAEMLSDNVVFGEIQGIVAARLFLVGWEGPGLPAFRRSLRGVPDELLDQLPSRHLVAIGREVAVLIDPDRRALGNSRSASTGASAPSSSAAGSATPETAPAPTSGSPSTSSAGPS